MPPEFANANGTWHQMPLSAYTGGVGQCAVYHAGVFLTALAVKKSTRFIPQGTLEAPAPY